MWRVAEFLQIEVLDYVVMSNHYHQLVAVTGKVDLTDEDLEQKVRTYYGPDSDEDMELKRALGKGGELAESVRKKHSKRMGDVSEFQKILKQGFTRWYNKGRKRRGTLWMDGLVLGSELFVEETFERCRGHFGKNRKSGARRIRGLASDSLRVMRVLRVDPIS